MARAIILVLDSFGIGATPDAERFGDQGANTLLHIAEHFKHNLGRELQIPQLTKLGLLAACEQATGCKLPINKTTPEKGAYGYAKELSTGKDTPSGHWEMAGVPVLFDWGYFTNKTNSFSAELQQKINQATGYSDMLGNCHASGTEIIARLGEQHIKTGLPICYTSADSVFQVAAHETHFGLDNLLRYCEQVRDVLDDYNIGRVIARPFVGETADTFERTGNRRDFSVLPPAPTLLDKLHNAGGTVISVGKIADIFAHQGIDIKTKATGIDALIDATLNHIQTSDDNSLIFTNLVNFDQDYGHRRDVEGYGLALEAFDKRLTEIYQTMRSDDLLVLTADHGCDPTWQGNDHTREYVPVLCYQQNIGSVNLGQRETFADIGQTLCEFFNLDRMDYGSSYLKDMT